MVLKKIKHDLENLDFMNQDNNELQTQIRKHSQKKASQRILTHSLSQKDGGRGGTLLFGINVGKPQGPQKSHPPHSEATHRLQQDQSINQIEQKYPKPSTP